MVLFFRKEKVQQILSIIGNDLTWGICLCVISGEFRVRRMGENRI